VRAAALLLCSRLQTLKASRHADVADAASDGDGGTTLVTVAMRVDPLGAGFFVSGTASVDPPPLRRCACCGASFPAPLESDFQVWRVLASASARRPCAQS
jgi:hypothetical protein